MTLSERFREVAAEPLPIPGRGRTPERHQRLFAVAEESVSLAKLAEAHWDAAAILAEAGREPAPGACYAVWASADAPGRPLSQEGGCLSGVKPFASGIGLVDRALLAAGPLLLEVDLQAHADCWSGDLSAWATEAFCETNTGAICFEGIPVADQVGPPGFYLDRPGFWHGALGPAACWAGGAAGLLAYARGSAREDPHTLAHCAAMEASVWAMRAWLDRAGEEIDRAPADQAAAHRRALTVRHLIEQTATEMLRRFARAYGPHPLAMDAQASRRFAETELFLRQNHGERDLEALGRRLREDLSNT